MSAAAQGDPWTLGSPHQDGQPGNWRFGDQGARLLDHHGYLVSRRRWSGSADLEGLWLELLLKMEVIRVS